MVRELFAKNLKKYRKQAGYTQVSFARLCGVSPSFIAHIETGDCNASITFIEKACAILKILPSLLFEDQPHNP